MALRFALCLVALVLVTPVAAIRKRVGFRSAAPLNVVTPTNTPTTSEFVLNRRVGGRLHGVWRLARRSKVPPDEPTVPFDPFQKIHNVTTTDFVVRHDSTLSMKRLRQFSEFVLPVDKVRFVVHGGDAYEIAQLDQVIGIWGLPRASKFTFASESFGYANDDTANVTIAVADTGLDVNHCSFYDTAPVSYSIVPNLVSSTHRKIKTYYSVCTETAVCSPTDRSDTFDGHGTHVSGIVAGQSCASHLGVQWASPIVFFDLQPGSTDPSLIDLPASVESWLDTAKACGVKAMFLSFGSGCDSTYNDLAAQIDRWLWLNPEMTVVVAAGNCGAPGATYKIACPACAKNVVSVGATYLGADAYRGRNVFSDSILNASPHLFARTTAATFSSPGPMRDGRVAPLVAAPGVAISSAAADPNGGPNHVGFIGMSGTSMACPSTPIGHIFVELQKKLHLDPPNYMVRAATVMMAEKCTYTSTPYFNTRLALEVSDDPNLRCGYGSVVFRKFDDSTVFIQDQISQGEMDTKCFTVESGRVVLAWNDRDSAFSAAVIDSLSLVVTWGTKQGKWNTNVVDNTKRIDFEFAEPTLVKIVVAAQNELTETKKYALIVSGVVAAESCPVTQCDDFEPTVVCDIPNGKGLITCVDSENVCAPQSCDDGFELTKTGCTPRNFDNDVISCPSYLHFNGTTCVCGFDLLCPDGSLNECIGGVVTECERVFALPGGPNQTVTDPTVTLTINETTLSVSWVFFGMLILTYVVWEWFMYQRRKVEPPPPQIRGSTKFGSVKKPTQNELFIAYAYTHSIINFFMCATGTASIGLFATDNYYGIWLYLFFAVFYGTLLFNQTHMIKTLVWYFVAYDLLVWVWVSVPYIIISVNWTAVFPWLLLVFAVVFMLWIWMPEFSETSACGYVAWVVAVIALAMMVYTVVSPGASTDVKIAAGVILSLLAIAAGTYGYFVISKTKLPAGMVVRTSPSAYLRFMDEHEDHE